MLPKKYRLIKREDFTTIFSRGCYVSGSEDVVIRYFKTDFPISRIGFPIGKNFSKKAVERNRMRRILRAAVFQYVAKLKPGFDIIVLVKPKHRDMEFKKITEDLGRVFFKANLLM